MIKIKQQFLYMIIIGISLIASCITFTNTKNIEQFDYSHQMQVSSISFWGPVMFYDKELQSGKKNNLLVLLKDNKLIYVVSSEYSHYKRYKYSALNDTTHLLVKEPNKPIMFSRINERDQHDSIIFYPNLCVRKTGARGRSRMYYPHRFTVFAINGQAIDQYEYNVPEADSTSPSINEFTDQFRNKFAEIKSIKKIRSLPLQADSKEVFFRQRIF